MRPASTARQNFNMHDTSFIAFVMERDIDLLLLEELKVSPTFARWFAARVAGVGTFDSTSGAWHSVVDAEHGESDLIFVFRTPDGAEHAILVENKISAPPQPDQAHRYRKRGDKGVVAGRWPTFTTCLVAPRAYLETADEAAIYDGMVAYEEMAEHFDASTGDAVRLAYKAQLLRAAIDQHRRGYQPQVNAAMTAFVQQYHALASTSFPALRMQAPKPRPATSTWILFSPPALRKGLQVWHQTSAGSVKLMFNNAIDDIDAIRVRYAAHVPDGMFVAPSGRRSVALSLEVPQLDPLTTAFDAQSERVVAALRGVARVVEVARKAGDLA